MLKRLAAAAVFILAVMFAVVVDWGSLVRAQEKSEANVQTSDLKPIAVPDEKAKIGKLLFSTWQERSQAVESKQRELEATIEARIEARTALLAEAERQHQEMAVKEPLCWRALAGQACYDFNFQTQTFIPRNGGRSGR